MSRREERYAIRSLCLLLGITRQGFYKYKVKVSEKEILSRSIILYCCYLRENENLPKSGSRELYELCRQYFKEKFIIGRDSFYSLLRNNGFMLRKRKIRPRTTNSRHSFYIYKDLVNTIPRFYPQSSGSLMVADITYVRCKEGFSYLSLLTDVYNRCIVGYCLFRTLETEGPLTALKNALRFYRDHNINIQKLIHHSDRGIQYASDSYIKLLKSNNIRISMTQTGDPLHNALAERMNNTLKNSWLFNNEALSFEEVKILLDRAVEMYNTARPHQALNMKTPMEMMTGINNNPLTFGYNYQRF